MLKAVPEPVVFVLPPIATDILVADVLLVALPSALAVLVAKTAKLERPAGPVTVVCECPGSVTVAVAVPLVRP